MFAHFPYQDNKIQMFNRLYSHQLYILTAFIYMAVSHHVNAQEDVSKTGWLTLENEHTISDLWSIKSDLHIRSTDNFKDLGNLLVRNWVNYSLSDESSIGLGYTYLGTWDGDIAFPDTYYAENRPFQQFQYDTKLSRLSKISQRIRLEQRFFTTELLPPFSLRSRYSAGWKKHFSSTPLGLSYIYIENELFFNLLGQKLSGGKLFEQNRLYSGLGFDLPNDCLLELGAYYEIQNDLFEQTNRTLIFQLRLITKI